LLICISSKLLHEEHLSRTYSPDQAENRGKRKRIERLEGMFKNSQEVSLRARKKGAIPSQEIPFARNEDLSCRFDSFMAAATGTLAKLPLMAMEVLLRKFRKKSA